MPNDTPDTSADRATRTAGALLALPSLWSLGVEAVGASGERGVSLTWGIKKPARIWYKLNVKYNHDVSCVTDCARIAIVFTTAQGLQRAAGFIGKRACVFKNRIANPTTGVAATDHRHAIHARRYVWHGASSRLLTHRRSTIRRGLP